MRSHIKCEDSRIFQFPEQVRMECCDKSFKPLIGKEAELAKPNDQVACVEGFKRDPISKDCIDVDECARNPRVCKNNEKCVNTHGGFNCKLILKCGKGYQMNTVGDRCEGDTTYFFYFNLIFNPPYLKFNILVGRRQ
jgi:hypothetical protein